MAEYKMGEPVDTKKLHKERGGSRPEWMIFWGVIGLVLFVSCAVIASKHTLLGWQASVFHDVNNTSLGNGATTFAKLVVSDGLVAGAIVACVLIPLLFKKYKVSWRFLVVAGGAGLLAEVVKRLVKEPRPTVMLHGHGFHARVADTGYAFPSAHTTVAAALALTLWFYLPVKWRFVSVIWILLVAWSRLFLGVHTPVDVIGGFGCGLLAVCVVRLLPHSIAKPLRLDD